MLTARPATLADREFLLRLRNDPAAVIASRVQNTVTPEEHAAWLATVLPDPSRRLMIVTCSGEGETADRYFPAGRIAAYRLDGLGTETVEVSLTVAPEHRGHGYARQIITLATDQAWTFSRTARVVATARTNNPRSLIAFLRAGYILHPQGFTELVYDGAVKRRAR